MGRHERARLVRQWMILNAGALGVMYSPTIKQAAVAVKKSVFPGGGDDAPPPAGSGGGGFGPVTESQSGTNSNEFALLDQPYAGIVLLVIAVASAALIFGGSKKAESNA